MSGNRSRRVTKETLIFDRQVFVIVVAFLEFWLNNRVDVAAVDSVGNRIDGSIDDDAVDVDAAVVVPVYYRNNTDIDATYSVDLSVLPKV